MRAFNLYPPEEVAHNFINMTLPRLLSRNPFRRQFSQWSLSLSADRAAHRPGRYLLRLIQLMLANLSRRGRKSEVILHHDVSAKIRHNPPPAGIYHRLTGLAGNICHESLVSCLNNVESVNPCSHHWLLSAEILLAEHGFYQLNKISII